MSSLFTKWGDMRVFLKMPKRLNRRDGCETDTALIESAEAFASLSFGFGTRMYLGRRIAELELHLLMTRIVQRFDISFRPEAENVEQFMRGVTIPDRSVRVQFVDRKLMSQVFMFHVHLAL